MEIEQREVGVAGVAGVQELQNKSIDVGAMDSGALFIL
jgi:hypothetical protein